MVWYLAMSTTFLVISHPSITNKDSHIPRFNTVHYGKHSLRYFGPYIWSRLVSKVKDKPTILDKTVEKIVYLDSIFLNIVAVPVLPSPPSPESNVVVYSRESLIPGRLWEATLDWGKGFSFRKGVVLEIALLRRRVDMMGKTFSSSFVQDCI